MKAIVCISLLALSVNVVAEKLPDGHPTIKQALGNPQEAKASLVNEATVKSVEQTDHYTYIEVEHEGGSFWLATQRADVKEGARIKYGNGASMKNFYSQTLKKEFPSILFVQEIEVVKD
jgi:hypothetical protein